MEKRYQIFVSSTFRDLVEERRAVISLIQEMNNIPAGMELFPSATEAPWRVIEKVIGSSDYYVLIIGGKYGSVDENGISFTEREYDLAHSLDIPILPFVPANPDEIPQGKIEIEPRARERLDSFRVKVESRHHRTAWETAEQLKGKVAVALVNAISQHPRDGWVRSTAVAEKAALLQELHDLRQENDAMRARLSQLDKAAHSFTDLFQHGSDPVDLELRDGQVHGTTWQEVFDALAPRLLTGLEEESVSRVLSHALKVNLSLSDHGVAAIRSQLLALDLLDVRSELVVSPPDELMGGRFGGPTRSLVAFWQLTPVGKRLYAHSTAVRRATGEATRQFLRPPTPHRF